MLKLLGVDGMSSDEEDFSMPGCQLYRVFRKAWRAPVVTHFLRVLDALHRRWRSLNGQGELRGAQPHLWFLTDDEAAEHRRAKPGLPENAYNPAWLASLPSTLLVNLDMEHTVYDFTHDHRIELYVVLDINHTYCLTF